MYIQSFGKHGVFRNNGKIQRLQNDNGTQFPWCVIDCVRHEQTLDGTL